MKYTKLPISIQNQVAKLRQRGLEFANEQKTEHCLSNISYYWLRNYNYPFLENTNLNTPNKIA